jgi:hypothetical protein
MKKKSIRPGAVAAVAKRQKDRQAQNGEPVPGKADIDDIVDAQESTAATKESRPAPGGRRGSKRPEEKGPQQGQGGRPAG